MKGRAPDSFGAHLRTLREAAGFTQEELATIAGVSVHAVSALERGRRRRPHPETVRALSTALDLTAADRDALLRAALASTRSAAVEPTAGLPFPQFLTPLIGREDDVAALRRWLADPGVRMITLVGAGGAGKTRLALETARAVAEAEAMRVVFVGLAAVRDAAFVPSAIAEVFGSVDLSPGDLPARVRTACDGRPTLLVLDNCEHVLEAVPLFASVLSAAPALRLLATSRSPLRVGGEREYPVGPLAVDAIPASSDGDQPLAPGVQLFVDRVRDVDPAFALTAANTDVIIAICRRLDGLPLALELAAPWLKVLPPNEVLERLERKVLSPAIGRRDLPERQQTMNATVAWSYHLLANDEQRTFRRFGILPARFPIEAAAAVLSEGLPAPVTADEALDSVAALIERSLLLRATGAETGRPLYRMLETVRAYAATEVVATGERELAMDGLARHCIAAAATASIHLTEREQGEWLDRVRDDLENYRAAMAWLMERGRPADACGIAFHLMFFWTIRGHATEGLQWFSRLADLPSLTGSGRVSALAGAAVTAYVQGDLDRARDVGERALALSGETSSLSAAFAENISAHVDIAVGSHAGARRRFARACERFEQLGLAWGVATSLAGSALVAAATGDLDDVERYLAAAREPLLKSGPWFLLLGLYVRAVLAVKHGRADDAIALARESLTHIDALHDKFALVYALMPLAAAAQLKGDAAWAARIFGARDGVTTRTGAMPVDDSLRDLLERVERDARARLGPRRWAHEYEAGRQALAASLIEEIDRLQACDTRVP